MHSKCPPALQHHLKRAMATATEGGATVAAEAAAELAPVIVHALVGQLVSE